MSRIGLIFLGFSLLVAADAGARVLPATARAWSLVDRGAAPVASSVRLLDLDDGGGAPRIAMNYNRDRFVSIFLSIIPGFGLGHFWINDDNGFFTFLIVDVVVWSAFFVGPRVIGLGFLFWVVLIGAKIWQVFDCVRTNRGGGGGDVLLPASPVALRPVEREPAASSGPLLVPLAAIPF